MKNAVDKHDEFRHNVMPNSEAQLVEEVFTNLGVDDLGIFRQEPPTVAESA
jgi:hypothetical protein